jgi:HKD family nuclease
LTSITAYMTPLFKKLNFKDQPAIVAINAPASFKAELKAMKAYTKIIEDLDKAKEIEFAIVFVTKQSEIDALTPAIHAKLKGDALLWYCYPKGTSKNYVCDFNRDTGWAVVGSFNLESVRMVAIDEDWSAIRFRKVEFIKTITRRESFAISAEAKKRTSQKGT